MTLPCATLPSDHPLFRRAAGLGRERPAVLWARGAPALDEDPAVAVVGTRHADRDALAFAHRLGHTLARAGVWVVSGGARGVDRAAHEGALAAGSPARTVAVLASGFAPPYPRGHTALFDRIVDAGGALVSEHPDGTPPWPSRFLERNRLLAAWSAAVVVVQAPRRSGALSTASWARRLGRLVFVVPAAPWDPRGEGNGALLLSGAQPCLDPVPVLDAVGAGPPPTRRAQRRRGSPGDPDAARVLRGLASRPQHADELAAETGLDAARVQRALLLLVLEGWAEDRGGGRWARPPGAAIAGR